MKTPKVGQGGGEPLTRGQHTGRRGQAASCIFSHGGVCAWPSRAQGWKALARRAANRGAGADGGVCPCIRCLHSDAHLAACLQLDAEELDPGHTATAGHAGEGSAVKIVQRVEGLPMCRRLISLDPRALGERGAGPLRRQPRLHRGLAGRCDLEIIILAWQALVDVNVGAEARQPLMYSCHVLLSCLTNALVVDIVRDMSNVY